jgi:hypothetical protein
VVGSGQRSERNGWHMRTPVCSRGEKAPGQVGKGTSARAGIVIEGL